MKSFRSNRTARLPQSSRNAAPPTSAAAEPDPVVSELESIPSRLQREYNEVLELERELATTINELVENRQSAKGLLAEFDGEAEIQQQLRADEQKAKEQFEAAEARVHAIKSMSLEMELFGNTSASRSESESRRFQQSVDDARELEKQAGTMREAVNTIQIKADRQRIEELKLKLMDQTKAKEAAVTRDQEIEIANEHFARLELAPLAETLKATAAQHDSLPDEVNQSRSNYFEEESRLLAVKSALATVEQEEQRAREELNEVVKALGLTANTEADERIFAERISAVQLKRQSEQGKLQRLKQELDSAAQKESEHLKLIALKEKESTIPAVSQSEIKEIGKLDLERKMKEGDVSDKQRILEWIKLKKVQKERKAEVASTRKTSKAEETNHAKELQAFADRRASLDSAKSEKRKLAEQCRQLEGEMSDAKTQERDRTVDSETKKLREEQERLQEQCTKLENELTTLLPELKGKSHVERAALVQKTESEFKTQHDQLRSELETAQRQLDDMQRSKETLMKKLHTDMESCLSLIPGVEREPPTPVAGGTTVEAETPAAAQQRKRKPKSKPKAKSRKRIR